jgi:hypothetical protein
LYIFTFLKKEEEIKNLGFQKKILGAFPEFAPKVFSDFWRRRKSAEKFWDFFFCGK